MLKKSINVLTDFIIDDIIYHWKDVKEYQKPPILETESILINRLPGERTTDTDELTAVNGRRKLVKLELGNCFVASAFSRYKVVVNKRTGEIVVAKNVHTLFGNNPKLARDGAELIEEMTFINGEDTYTIYGAVCSPKGEVRAENVDFSTLIIKSA